MSSWDPISGIPKFQRRPLCHTSTVHDRQQQHCSMIPMITEEGPTSEASRMSSFRAALRPAGGPRAKLLLKSSRNAPPWQRKRCISLFKSGNHM